MLPETGPADPDDATPPDGDDQPAAAPTPRPAEPIVPTKAREDTDVGWGDDADPGDDDRLLRDRPPHWDNG